MKALHYFDYAATTPTAPEVIEKMLGYLGPDGIFANPAAKMHFYGWQAEQHVQRARVEVAELIAATADEIIWTSGATESDNLALKGVALHPDNTFKHIITSQIEHKAILDTCAELEKLGFEVTYLAPDPRTGIIHPEQVRAAIRPDTCLVSLMMVNNEIGTMTDIATIGEITRHHQILFHVDAAQAAGKLEIDVQSMHVDLMSLSAHKMYGPKGIGALYIRQAIGHKIKAQMHGGGHEHGFRSGTLATHQIVAMGHAAVLANHSLTDEQQRLHELKQYFYESLNALTAVQINGDPAQSVANCLNISFINDDANIYLERIHQLAAVSKGSACNAHRAAYSHVLQALNIDAALAQNTLRFSFGLYTTQEQVRSFIQALAEPYSTQWVKFLHTEGDVLP